MDFEEMKWKSAEECFLSAVRENPGHSLAYNYLGKIYLKFGDAHQSDEMFHKALTVNPRDTQARLELAAIEVKAGRRDAALNYYKANLAVAAHDGETLLALLRLDISRHDLDGAMDTVQDLLRYNRDSATLTVAAELLAQQGSSDLAFEVFKRALSVNPKDKEIYMELGKLLGNMDRFEDAIRVWQEGAALDPQDLRFEMLIRQAKDLRTASRNN